MRFYNQSHQFYCGIDLHARTLYLCVLDQAGTIRLHKEIPAEPAALLEALAPFRDNLVVAAECMFAWYWLADLTPHSCLVQLRLQPFHENNRRRPKQRDQSIGETREEKRREKSSTSVVRPIDFQGHIAVRR